MKVLFLPFSETWENEKQRVLVQNSASSRFRCEWVARYWPEASIWHNGIPFYNYDAYVFQKAYTLKFLEIAQTVKDDGKIIIFDVCDAGWDISTRDLFERMMKLADYVTCSSEYIRQYVVRTYRKPVYFIPDRVDLREFPTIKAHSDEGTRRVIWFGNRNTIPYLIAMNDVLFLANKKTPFTLVLLSDTFDGYTPIGPEGPEIEKVVWSREKANDTILSCDMTLNPHDFDIETGRAKSDNKTITAWALGLPVVSHGNTHRIESLLCAYLRSASLRNDVGSIGRRMVEQLYDVRTSVLEYQYVIKEAVWMTKVN